jgi:hypothetical protein
MYEEWEKVKYSTPLRPLVTRSMLEKERGGTLKRTPSLEKPSLTIMGCLKIDAACTHCNTTFTF